MRPFLILAISVLFLCSCATKSFVRDEIRKAVHSQRYDVTRSFLSTIDTSWQTYNQLKIMDNRLETVEIESGRALAIADHVLWKINDKVIVTEFIPYLAEREINFAFDSYGLNKDAVAILNEIGEMLRSNSEYKLTIEGHADSVASDIYNQDLGRRRAEEVERYLVKKFSVSLHRIFSLTFGESTPKVSNATGAGRMANRRVVLQIWVPL